MNGLFRDCNVSPMHDDNTYIGSCLKCDYTQISDIVGQSHDHIKNIMSHQLMIVLNIKLLLDIIQF